MGGGGTDSRRKGQFLGKLGSAKQRVGDAALSQITEEFLVGLQTCAYIPGHSLVCGQGDVSMASPSHVRPPYWGSGLSQRLVGVSNFIELSFRVRVRVIGNSTKV